MRPRLLFSMLAVCVMATLAMTAFLPEGGGSWIYLPEGLSVLFLIQLFRSVVKTTSTAMRGMELISAQDFNNRLTKVGEGNADRIVTLFNTLIDRLRNERLKNLEQDSFLHLLIEASPMGVLILDFNGRAILVNNSMLRLLEISDENEVLGREIDMLPTDLAANLAMVPMGNNMIIRRGDVRMYRCYHLNFIQTGFSRRFYLLESLTEEVMKAEREAYEKVIRIISHEVNNTMGGVKSVLGLLHDSVEDDDVRDVIESCDERCDVMCGFIRTYADVVKVPDPVKCVVDLGHELSAIVPFLREMAGDKIEIELIAEEKLGVNIDMALMQQVVVNIVKNAVESIVEKGHINIKAGRRGGHVWMEISNDGEPISEQASRNLFSPFFTTKREGRGLGLMLTGDILKGHGARFSLRTDKDDITRFYIEFAASDTVLLK